MKITYWIASLLIVLTVLMNYLRHPIPAPLENTRLGLPLSASIIERVGFYDWPAPYQLAEEIDLDHLERTPASLLEKIVTTPVWPGFLPQLLGYSEGADAPWFEKISQGEWWRLFTPALLHYELFHLIFNLFWLIILGRLLEERIGIAKYLLISLILAIGSNTAQYLMSGFRFLGYSGVVAGLFGFIYLHRRRVPYGLPDSLFNSMFIFIFGMAALEAISLFSPLNLRIGIANTAHISGLLLGLLLAKGFTYERA